MTRLLWGAVVWGVSVKAEPIPQPEGGRHHSAPTYSAEIDWDFVGRNQHLRFDQVLTSVPERSGHCPPTSWVSKFWAISVPNGRIDSLEVKKWANEAFSDCKQSCLGLDHSYNSVLSPQIILEEINKRNCDCIICLKDQTKLLSNSYNEYQILDGYAADEWDTCQCDPNFMDPPKPEDKPEGKPESEPKGEPEPESEINWNNVDHDTPFDAVLTSVPENSGYCPPTAWVEKFWDLSIKNEVGHSEDTLIDMTGQAFMHCRQKCIDNKYFNPLNLQWSKKITPQVILQNINDRNCECIHCLKTMPFAKINHYYNVFRDLEGVAVDEWETCECVIANPGTASQGEPSGEPKGEPEGKSEDEPEAEPEKDARNPYQYAIEWNRVEENPNIPFYEILNSVPESSGFCPPTNWVKKFWEISIPNGRKGDPKVAGWSNSVFGHCKTYCLGKSSYFQTVLTPEMILDQVNQRNCECIACIHNLQEVKEQRSWLFSSEKNEFLDLNYIDQVEWSTCTCASADSVPEGETEGEPEGKPEAEPENNGPVIKDARTINIDWNLVNQEARSARGSEFTDHLISVPEESGHCPPTLWVKRFWDIITHPEYTSTNDQKLLINAHEAFRQCKKQCKASHASRLTPQMILDQINKRNCACIECVRYPGKLIRYGYEKARARMSNPFVRQLENYVKEDWSYCQCKGPFWQNPEAKPEPEPKGEYSIKGKGYELKKGFDKGYNNVLNDLSMVGVQPRHEDWDYELNWPEIKNWKRITGREPDMRNHLTSVPENAGHCPPTEWVEKFWEISTHNENSESGQVLGWANAAFKHCKPACLGQAPKWWEPIMTFNRFGNSLSDKKSQSLMITHKIILDEIQKRNCACIRCVRKAGIWLKPENIFNGEEFVNLHASNRFVNELNGLALNAWNTCQCEDGVMYEPEAEPEAEPERNPESDPEGKPEGQPEGNPEAEPEGGHHVVRVAEYIPKHDQPKGRSGYYEGWETDPHHVHTKDLPENQGQPEPQQEPPQEKTYGRAPPIFGPRKRIAGLFSLGTNGLNLDMSRVKSFYSNERNQASG